MIHGFWYIDLHLNIREADEEELQQRKASSCLPGIYRQWTGSIAGTCKCPVCSLCCCDFVVKVNLVFCCCILLWWNIACAERFSNLSLSGLSHPTTSYSNIFYLCLFCPLFKMCAGFLVFLLSVVSSLLPSFDLAALPSEHDSITLGTRMPLPAEKSRENIFSHAFKN